MSAKTIIIDTREPSEYETSHAEGAINIPPAAFMLGEVPEQLRNTPKDAPIILYCRSGQRSNTCMMVLKQHGFTNLKNGVNEHRVLQLL